MSAFLASSGKCATSDRTLLCMEVVPFSRTAAGISVLIPASISPLQINSIEEIPIRKTSVPFRRTSAGKSILEAPSFLGCPVITWKEDV